MILSACFLSLFIPRGSAWATSRSSVIIVFRAKNYPVGHHLALAVQARGSLDQGRERGCAFFAKNEAAVEDH